MSNAIPGLKIEASPTPPKPTAKSGTVWAVAAMIISQLLGKWFPTMIGNEELTNLIADTLSGVFGFIAAWKARTAIENSRIPVTVEAIKK